MPMNPIYMMNRLFQEHPTGHETRVPCTHSPTWEARNGNIQLPCPHITGTVDVGVHWEKRQPVDPWGNPVFGGEVWVLVPDAGNTINFGRQHGANAPEDQITFQYSIPILPHLQGDPGPTLPCLHPMPLRKSVAGLWIDFYTGNEFIQEETVEAVARLLYLGATIASPGRPLNVFHREYLEGFPSDYRNPFRSHYDFFTNSVQILDEDVTQDELRDTLHHLLGHATLGDRSNPVGEHALKGLSHPALAMSEGWAHFVVLAIRSGQQEAPDKYMSLKWETRDETIPLSPNIAYNVACTLWDCYDSRPTIVIGGLETDAVQVPFDELYRVYSPTPATIAHGSQLNNVDDYLERLLANRPDITKNHVQTIRDRNCGFARKVTFSTSEGMYLRTPGSSPSDVEGIKADKTVVEPNAIFLMEKAETTPFKDGDRVHIKARSGSYLVAEDGGNSMLDANRDLPYQWETFVLERIDGSGAVTKYDKVSLRLDGTTYYVRAKHDPLGLPRGDVSVTGKSRGTEETFTISFL